MKTIQKIAFLVLLLFTTNSFSQVKETPTVLIKGGSYIPLYGRDSVLVTVPDFKMDVYPVTNEQYLQFLKDNPTWRKSKVLSLFADKSYLTNWVSDLDYGKLNPKSPINHVSWFAAKSYCDCQGKRLATIDEWEYVAMANETQADARSLESYNSFILSWYEKPKVANQTVGSTFKNYWGVYDMHGLLWEWTLDFNSVLISGESRKDVDNDSNQFCGSAAVNATDLMNYAAFMRYAIRGSLKAKYTMKNLTFRCIKDVK